MFSKLGNFFYFLAELTDRKYESYGQFLKEKMWKIVLYCSFGIIGSVYMILFVFDGLFWNILFGFNIIANFVLLALFYFEFSEDIKTHKVL